MNCLYCNKSKLILIPEVYPYSSEHLQCCECDSTFNIEEYQFDDDGFYEYDIWDIEYWENQM